jgi:transcriptional regulator with XRE-family HTH domain
MISYRVLSEVEKFCEDKKISKKDLAERVDTSLNYITELFRGTKLVDTYIMAKFEEAMDVSFEIGLKSRIELHEGHTTTHKQG